MIRIVFFGTPFFAAEALRHFLSCPAIEISAVVSNPDAKIGRNQILTPSPVKYLAQENNIQVFTPESAKDIDFLEAMKKINADFFVVVSYGKILPKSLIDIPKKGTFNLHFSLLPKFRGASPVQSAIESGETQSGISIFQIVPELDAGDIAVQIPYDLSNQTTQEALNEMTAIGSHAFVDFIMHSEKYPLVPQDHSQATFCTKIEKSSGQVFAQNQSAEEIIRKYRAYTPWPGIFSILPDGKRILWKDIFLENTDAIEHPINTLFEHNKQIFWQTKKGTLLIKTFQIEGKQPTPARIIAL